MITIRCTIPGTKAGKLNFANQYTVYQCKEGDFFLGKKLFI
jgi:hypothetical protein